MLAAGAQTRVSVTQAKSYVAQTLLSVQVLGRIEYEFEDKLDSHPTRHIPHPLHEQLAHRHRELREELRFEGESLR